MKELIFCLLLVTTNCYFTIAYSNDYFDELDYSQFSLFWGNDAIAPMPSDKYLTNVIRVELETDKVPAFLDRLFPGKENLISYKLGQNIYTPEDIEKEYIDGEDRPYAGWMYLEISFYTRIEKSKMDVYGVKVGVVGPYALGGETQSYIHKLIGSADPAGWDNQLDNEFAVDLFYKRVYSMRKDFGRFTFETLPYWGVTTGNVHINSSTGIVARYGYNVPDDMASITFDSNYSHNYKDKRTNFRAYLFVKGEGSIIGRDIFLDGNSFEDDPRAVTTIPFRYSVSAGVTLGYKKLDVIFAVNYDSKEFEEQAEPQQSGIIMFKYSF